MLAGALELLLSQERIVFKPATTMLDVICVIADGVPIPKNMPFVKRKPPKGGFKKPHYLPCFVCLTKKPGEEERQRSIDEVLALDGLD